MKKEEIQKEIWKTHLNKDNPFKEVCEVAEKIHESFTSRTCTNCKEMKECCLAEDITKYEDNGKRLSIDTFSCDLWKEKDE